MENTSRGLEHRDYTDLLSVAGDDPVSTFNCAESDNRERASKAARVLADFAELNSQDRGEPVIDIMTDLLTNMMHLCDIFGADPSLLSDRVQIAMIHYSAETE